MLGKLCLGLLLSTVCAFAQPVEGPWEVATSTNAITSPEVCVRGSNADVLYIENDSVRYARFSLATHELIAGPTPVFALQGWNTQQLHDLIALNDSTWACLVSEDNWGGPGQNDSPHRVDLLHGEDNASSSVPLDSSITHYYFPAQYEYWDEGFSLTPRIGAGAIAAWISPTFNGMDLSVFSKVFALESDFSASFDWFGGLGLLGNPEGNRIIGRAVTSDSNLVVAGGGPFCFATINDEYLGCTGTECNFSVVYEFGLTRSGNREALVCDQDFSCNPYIVTFDVHPEGIVICSASSINDIPLVLDATCWHQDYGFSALQVARSSLQLARVDTNGIQTQPIGTMFWRDDNHTFTEANVTIADDGLIVAAWTETQNGDTAARRLMLGTVGWNTPLSVDRWPEAAASSYDLSAYPNPFNGTLEIRYELPRAEKVQVAVFNVLGQKVADLEEGMRSAGTHNVMWMAETGSGIYFVSLQTEQGMRTEKVLLAR